jgi:hypothetical protein
MAGTRDLRPCPQGGPHRVIVPGIHIERAADVILRDCEIAWRGERLTGYGRPLLPSMHRDW